MAETSISKATKQNDWPTGENLIIAIAPHGGWSQEDSIVRNKSSIERGSGRITHFQVLRTTCKKKPDQEFLEHPLFRKGQYECKDPCSGLRGGADYSKIGFDGLPEIGTPIRNNDVIIGKVMYKFQEEEGVEYKNSVKVLNEEEGNITKRDKSVVFQCEENEIYFVENVMLSTNMEGNKSVRIKLRSMRIAQEGDKMSSRHGQKGTIGAIISEEDLPYVAYGPNAGMRPDAIINVHCINGRMTIGKLLEILYSSLGLIKGQFPDATPFRDASAEWAMDEILKAGYGVEETMMCGTTGQVMKKPGFIGSCFYQFLKHMVLDKITARQRGPRVFLTRQPLDGRANGGGQRLGEMEKDALLSHGAAYVLDDRTRIASDGHTVMVCSKCGHIGESKNESLHNLYVDYEEDMACRLCGNPEFLTLPTTYCYSNLLIPELATCGIKVTHTIE
jgi:DNA-directed RNA polymerase beta subunit